MDWLTLGKLAIDALQEPDPESLMARATRAKKKLDEAAEAIVLFGFLVAPKKEVLEQCSEESNTP